MFENGRAVKEDDGEGQPVEGTHEVLLYTSCFERRKYTGDKKATVYFHYIGD